MPKHIYFTEGTKIFQVANRLFLDISNRELDNFLKKIGLMRIEKGSFFTPKISHLPRAFWQSYNKEIGGNR